MIGDSAAMIVDSMTYGFNLYAERKKNEDNENEDIHADEVEIEMPTTRDNDTDDITTTDNDSYNLERIRLRKRKKILHYELKVRIGIVLSCEFKCSICSLVDLSASFGLHVSLFNCLCKSDILTKVTISSLSSS